MASGVATIHGVTVRRESQVVGGLGAADFHVPSARPRATSPWLPIVGATMALLFAVWKTNYAVSLGLVAVAFVLMETSSGVTRIRRPTIAGVWFICFLGLIFVPGLALASGTQGPVREQFLLAIHIELVAVPLGIWAARLVSRNPYSNTMAWFASPVFGGNWPRRRRNVRLILLAAVSVVGVAAYFVIVSTVPLLNFFGGEASYQALVDQRDQSFKFLPTAPAYVFSFLRSLVLPILAAVTLGRWLRQPTWRGGLAFAAAAALASFFAALSLAKSPFLVVWAILGMTYWLHRAERARMAIAVLVAILALSFPLAVAQRSSSSGITLNVAAKSVRDRIAFAPAEALYYYFEAFPTMDGHLHGRSIGRLSALLGLEYFDSANYVANLIYRKQGGLGTTDGTNNAAFIGDLWADFGMAGVIIGSFFAGILIQVLQILVERRSRTSTSLALYAFLCVTTAVLLNTAALPYFLLSGGAVLAFWLANFVDAPRGVLGDRTIEVH